MLEVELLGWVKFGRPKLPVFQRPRLREGRELGVLMLRGSNLPAFHRLGFVGGRAVWVAKVLVIKLVCVLAAGLGGGWAAGWIKIGRQTCLCFSDWVWWRLGCRGG